MANNDDLTNHEVYDSFYASPKEREKWEATRGQRKKAIRRMVLGAVGVIVFGFLAPAIAALLGLEGILSEIVMFSPPMLCGAIGLIGFIQFMRLQNKE